MAKIEKATKLSSYQAIKKIKPWLANKVAEARRLSEHRAARAARRWGAPAGVALVVLLLVGSFFLPKDNFQQTKENLLRNPDDFQAQTALAEAFLENNQFEEAERALLLAQKHLRGGVAPQSNVAGTFDVPPTAHLGGEDVLGEQHNSKLEELWQKKHYSDPKDIKRLIIAWEKIVSEKPNYRDGYLQLAHLHYKLYDNEKAKEYLQKAIELDPNYEPARKFKETLSD